MLLNRAASSLRAGAAHLGATVHRLAFCTVIRLHRRWLTRILLILLLALKTRCRLSGAYFLIACMTAAVVVSQRTVARRVRVLGSHGLLTEVVALLMMPAGVVVLGTVC